MNDDLKQKTILFIAIFLTTFVVMQYMGWMRQELPAEPPGSVEVDPSTEDPAAPPTEPKADPVAKADPGKPVSPPKESPAASRVIDSICIVRPIGTDEPEERLEATFTSLGAALKRFRLLGYYQTAERRDGEEVLLLDEVAPKQFSLYLELLGTEDVAKLNYAVLSAPTDATVEPAEAKIPRNTENKLIFEASAAGWRIRKTYQFDPKTAYGFTMDLEFQNLQASTTPLRYNLVGPSGIVPDDVSSRYPVEAMTANLVEAQNGEVAVERRYGRDLIDEAQAPSTSEPALSWAGVRNRFFAAILAMEEDGLVGEIETRSLKATPAYVRGQSPFYAKLLVAHKDSKDRYPNVETAFIFDEDIKVGAGKAVVHKFRFYGGPTEEEILTAQDKRFNNVVDYSWGIFSWISLLLLSLLDAIAGVVKNYGVAMILLTLIVKSALHPLTRKALASGHKMQKIAPRMKELQKKYANDRAKLNQEVMRMYSEEGVNPMGGCLPMLLQLPIFLALYGAFAKGFGIRQASFIPGWINDLSQPDAIYEWGAMLPVIGNQLNLLPVFYLVLQLIHMSMQPQSNDPQVAQQQKMMKIMPLVFVFIFYSMPSGLVLYFAISSAYTIAEHWLIKRKLGDDETPAAGGAAVATAGAAGPSIGAGVGIGQKDKKKKKK